MHYLNHSCLPVTFEEEEKMPPFLPTLKVYLFIYLFISPVFLIC